MTYPHSLSLHMKMSHIRYHVPHCQTKEYRGGGATALSILTSDQLFYFQEDRFWYPLRNVVHTRTHLDVMTMKEIPSPVRYRTPDENHTANHFSGCSQRQYGTTSRRCCSNGGRSVPPKSSKWERTKLIQPETQHTQCCLFNDHRGK